METTSNAENNSLENTESVKNDKRLILFNKDYTNVKERIETLN
ncbi:MAG: hypothetical protein ACK5LT_09635 [Lachnospirales bacterium]